MAAGWGTPTLARMAPSQLPEGHSVVGTDDNAVFSEAPRQLPRNKCRPRNGPAGVQDGLRKNCRVYARGQSLPPAAGRATTPRLIRLLADGSRVIQIPLRALPARADSRVARVRETRVRVGRRGARPHEVHLWTSLLDPRTRPRSTSRTSIRSGGSMSSTFARSSGSCGRRTCHRVIPSKPARRRLRRSSSPVHGSPLRGNAPRRPSGLRISFPKLLDVVTAVWQWVDLGNGILTGSQLDRILHRGYPRMRQCLTPGRRPRTNPRAVRQPTQAWARLLHTLNRAGFIGGLFPREDGAHGTTEQVFSGGP